MATVEGTQKDVHVAPDAGGNAGAVVTGPAPTQTQAGAMKRGGIDQEAVSRAVRSLGARGEKVTQANVREELGGGSLSTIGPLLRAHRIEIRTRASESLEKHVPAGLREQLLSALQVTRDEGRREAEAELLESRELHEEDARAIANLERDNGRLHDEVADLEAEIDQLRVTITSMQAAQVARDKERDARLTKSVADAAAAENARLEAQRQAWHFETLLRVESEAAEAVRNELAKERAHQQAAEKARATAEAKLVHAEALVATREAEKVAAAQALETEREKRGTAEKATSAAELKLGRAEARAEVLATTREEEQRLAAQALDAERRALNAERKARETASKAAGVADTRVAAYEASVARLERELEASRMELSQTRDALHAAEPATSRSKDTPTAAAKPSTAQSNKSNQDPRRKDKGTP